MSTILQAIYWLTVGRHERGLQSEIVSGVGAPPRADLFRRAAR